MLTIQCLFFLSVNCTFSLVYSGHCYISLRMKVIRCDCSSRNLTFIPTECPQNTSELYLANNYLNILGKETFSRYTHLTYLDIGNCNITSIEQSAFDDLTQLKDLIFFNNPMKTFQTNVFAPLNDLRVLSVSHNLLSTYPRESWSDFFKITTLICEDGPSNGTFSEIFSAMTNLNYFQVDYQSDVIHNFTFNSFKRTPLKYLNIGGHLRIIEIDSFAPLELLSSLIIPNQNFLKLSNTLPALHVFENRQMDELDLRNDFRNYGEYVISADLFAYIGNICVKKLSLGWNGIRMIDATAFQKMKYKHCLEILNLNHNDFDYHQDLIVLYINFFINIKRIDISSITSKSFENIREQKSISRRPLDYRLTTDTRSDWSVRLPSSLEFLNASFIIGRNNLINSITFKGITRLKIIDFTYSSLDDCNYTVNGLQNVEILNISHFKCGLLNHNLLQSVVNLEQLIMQSSLLSIGLKDDHHSIFLHGLKRLQYIDFSKNAFEDRFRIATFKSQRDSLQSLILEGNLFTSIPLHLVDLNRLSFLNIRNNKIAYLTTKEIDAIEVLFEKSNRTMTVLLEGNPLVCSCASVDFVEWLFTTKVKLDSNGSYSCVKNDGNITTTNAVYNHLRIMRIRCITTVWLIFSATIFGVLLLFILVGYRYKLHLQYFCLFIGMANPLFRKSKEEELEYDAYVAYCDGDYKWVYGPLRLFLEERRNYKLLLQDRGDVISGQHRLFAISNAIPKCKKIILVISKEFVNNDWAYYEATVGIEHFLGLQARIIVINLESITKTKIPQCVLQMMSLNANDHIRKTDTLHENNIFWKCLDKAMKR
ncbi:toll-like receptor 4 [Mytilus californianus]|uniref:toll-like receptor 4 n=1 Tax=Mytilus californianus TaxID=6549 RepID=UPI0022456D29|nr:toll-like receptor 4 [Mytilus californianus]